MLIVGNMAKKKIETVDITKTGPQGFRQLQEANNDPFVGIRPQPTSLFDISANREQLVKSPLADTSTPWGESMWDDDTATQEEFSHLGDIRAENQPWFAKIGAGLAKGVVLAGTTFLNGTVGLLTGLGTWAATGNISGIWNNEFSRAMDAVNKWSEESMPNYYTEAEQST